MPSAATTTRKFPDPRALQASGCFSSPLFQDDRCPGFRIHLSNYFISADPGWSRGDKDEPLLNLQFVLRHSLHFQVEGGPPQIMMEGQYNLIASSSLHQISWFGAINSHTSTLDIHLSPSWLLQLAVDYPELADWLERRGKGIRLFGPTPGTVTPGMLRILNELIDCGYTGELRSVYMQSKVPALLLLALEQIIHRPAEKEIPILLRRYDIEKIHETRAYLLLHMENPPTLKELAHKMGMNDFKLKKGYKQVFGTTIFGDFTRARMEKAMYYLVETDLPLTEISLQIGYQDPPNFIRAFKSYYGSTPGQVRKHARLSNIQQP